MNKWTRRAFIATGGVVGGGLAIGLGGVAFAPNRIGVVPDEDGDAPQLTTWLRIAADNTVTVIMPHCEMGQGAHTALAMMLAEELEADWNLVRIEEAPADSAYANGYLVRVFLPIAASVPRFMERSVDYASFKLTQLMDLQVTGGSSSVRGTGQLGMRVAGAAGKSMLLAAAAKRWNVPASECAARLSHVTHAESGRTASFGELAAEAAQLDPPVHPTLKRREQYSIVGRATPRFDIPSKVNGVATYAIDVALPGMLYATVRAAPVFGARLNAVDPKVAERMPGVVKVVQLENAVAVVADGYWRALQATRALTPSFSNTDRNGATSDAIFETYRAALERNDGDKVHSSGNATKALSAAAKTIEAEYRAPFLAHATMEPMSATVRIADGRCEVWTGVQDPLGARKVAAKAADLDEDDVILHNQQLGGGFGRRLPGAHDYVDQAVRIAKIMSPAPVKLIWSREEDIQHDFYRPAVLGRFQGALDSIGAPLVWISRFNGPGGEAARTAYAIAHQDIRAIEHDTHVRLGSWRSVEHSQHGFFSECFVDELAHAAGKEPLGFRLALLTNAPRHRAVLEKAALMSGWGEPLAAGRGRGVALVESFGTIVAEDGRSRSGRWTHQGASRVRGCRLRRSGQSGYGCGADRRRSHLRHGGGAVQRDHDPRRAGRADKFQRLSDAETGRCAAYHGGVHAVRCADGRTGRTRRPTDRAGDSERSVRGDGPAAANAALEDLRAESRKERKEHEV